jgi:hypothetical protein
MLPLVSLPPSGLRKKGRLEPGRPGIGRILNEKNGKLLSFEWGASGLEIGGTGVSFSQTGKGKRIINVK